MLTTIQVQLGVWILLLPTALTEVSVSVINSSSLALITNRSRLYPVTQIEMVRQMSDVRYAFQVDEMQTRHLKTCGTPRHAHDVPIP
jgi:hypothetical protein